jgi:hypothetical protein
MLRPAFLYFALAFAAGFLLAIPRILVLTPRVGEVIAVLIECPIILLISFLLARWVIHRFAPRAAPARRLAIGLIAFALLITAELLLSWARGTTPREFAAGLLLPARAIGLAAQVLFALFPLLVRPRTPA